jgi:2Fe-2S ferredoxin
LTIEEIGLAKVKIINDNLEVEVSLGEKILDKVKDKSGFPYGCENAECGMCLCSVVKGAENLEAANHKEWTYLQKKNAPRGQRLGCQLRIKREEGEVEIEY